MARSRRRRRRKRKRKRNWDDLSPLRYPITSAHIRTDLLGVFIRRAELKTWIGRRDPVSLTAVVTQGVTVLEQFTKLTLEEHLDRRGWKGGASHAVVGVEGEDGDVRISKSRLAAIGRTFQSVKPILEMSEECGLAPLKKCVEELKDGLERMFGLRHDLTHALASGRFEVEEFPHIIWQVMRAGLEGRPMYVAAALLIEASVMDAAGRADGVREAAEEALEICDGVLEGVPEGGDEDDAPLARVFRAHALARLRRTGEAEDAYREAAEKSPRDVLPLVGMGHLLVQAGRPEEAVEWYARAVDINPDHVAARTSMGHALAVVRGADGTKSVQCYQDAMRGGFDDVSLRAGYGTALAMMGLYEEAAAQYRRAIELDPGDAAACVGLGNALTALKKHGEAVGMYEEGIRLGAAAVPVRDEVLGEESEAGIFALGLGGAAAHRGLGNALIETGNPERAAVALGRAASLDPGSLEAQVWLGRALYMCGRYEETVRAGQRAVEIDAGNLEAQVGLGRALYMCGRYEEAVRAGQRAVGIDAGSLEAQVGLGRALYMCGRYEEAVRAGQLAIGIDAGSLEAQLGLGRALYMCGRYEEAVRAGQRAVGIDARSLEAQTGLGRALYMCGRYEEAVTAYRAALVLDAGSDEAHSGLGLALRRWEKDAGR